MQNCFMQVSIDHLMLQLNSLGMSRRFISRIAYFLLGCFILWLCLQGDSFDNGGDDFRYENAQFSN